MRLYTQEFLRELQEGYEEIDVLDYLMMVKGMKFNDAIEELAQVLNLEPEYCKPAEGKKEKK